MNDILIRLKQLEEVRRDYEDLWADETWYVNPRRELIKDSQRFDTKGQRRGKQSYDGTPNGALNVWADGMQGFMVAQSLRWFMSEMDDWRLNSIDEVRIYLQEYDEAMYAAYNRSNFYSILGEWFRDAGSVGTATLYTEEDIKRKSAVHVPIHPREVFISENLYGEVDTLFRKFQLTARQAVQRFGEENLDKLIVDNAKEHPEKKHEFVHAVFPNEDWMPNSLAPTKRKYKSVYVQVASSGSPVREGGYDIFPYAVWRYRKNSDEVYGYSPAADAMTEIYGLNQFGQTLLRAAQMSVAPPFNVPAQMRGNVQIMPEGLNYTDNHNDKITPIMTNINFPVGIDREQKLQKLIEDKYRVEFFLILARSEREMTATEIMERQSEKAVLMGPQVDRLIVEGLRRNFDNVSDIEDRAGRLPQPPPVLFDAIEKAKESGTKEPDISTRFIGPLAQAQRRLFKMQPITNGLNSLAQASVLFPNIVDRVNEYKLSENILDSADFPQDLMRTDAELDELRKARAEQQAREQATAMLGQAAEGYPKLTKAPEAGSPAAALIGA